MGNPSSPCTQTETQEITRSVSKTSIYSSTQGDIYSGLTISREFDFNTIGEMLQSFIPQLTDNVAIQELFGDVLQAQTR